MANYKTIISAKDLFALIQGSVKNQLIIDCSFDLTNLEAGIKAYQAGHIPGAHYMNLENQLSAKKTGHNGRHPLPSREAFLAVLANLGVNENTQIFIYDNACGMYASRVWWMCRWVGHDLAAVLDGGIAAWQREGFPVVDTESVKLPANNLLMRDSKVDLVLYQQVFDNLKTSEFLVLDARAPDRFRGENETLDPIGGHIPGARNRFFRNNLTESGVFKSPSELLKDFQGLIGSRLPTEIICQCGSGVTACHNLLAMEVAGLIGASLYAGSWSEWCAQPSAEIATGDSV